MLLVQDLFDVAYGQSLELNRLTRVVPPNGVNFVSRAMRNNGVTARVAVPGGVEPSPAGCLSVALSGNGVLSTFVQPEPFICGFHVAVLMPKREMSVGELLWWAQAIHANAYRYSYGRQANRTIRTIELPTEIPDWVFETAAPGQLTTDLACYLPEPLVPSVTPAAPYVRAGAGFVRRSVWAVLGVESPNQGFCSAGCEFR